MTSQNEFSFEEIIIQPVKGIGSIDSNEGNAAAKQSTCIECGATFRSETEVEEHMNSKHKGIKTNCCIVNRFRAKIKESKL